MTRRYESDAAVEARLSEIEAHRAGEYEPLPHSGQPRVCLVKRPRIDADWIRRHRTTTVQQQKIADQLRAQYGPDVRISFGGAQ